MTNAWVNDKCMVKRLIDQHRSTRAAHSPPIHMTLRCKLNSTDHFRHIHWRCSYSHVGHFRRLRYSRWGNMTPLAAWLSDPLLEGTPLFSQINIYSYIGVRVLYNVCKCSLTRDSFKVRTSTFTLRPTLNVNSRVFIKNMYSSSAVHLYRTLLCKSQVKALITLYSYHPSRVR
jgi:hypothetical protein